MRSPSILSSRAAVALALAGVAVPWAPGLARATEILAGPYLQDASPVSVWVGWESSTGEESRVDYGTTPKLGTTATGEAIPSVGDAHIHHVQLTELVPDTRYYYRVTTGDAASAVAHFRTPAPAAAERSFRFFAYSDPQISPAFLKHREVVNDGILAFVADAFGPDPADELAFGLVAGDLVDEGALVGQWRNQYFGQAQNLFELVPHYPVIGNHEDDHPLYFKYLRLPENGTPGFLEHWYWKDHGNVRVIGLDSNDAYRLQVQLDWLDQVLADAALSSEIDFVFAQLHHPFHSEFLLGDESDYTGEVVRRLEAFTQATGKASVHFFGHTHAYSRGQSRDHQHLWVNVASAMGSIDYWEGAGADYPEFQKSLPEWGFLVGEVTAGDTPSLRLRRVSRGNDVQRRDNEVRDDVTIRVGNVAPATPVALSPGETDALVNPDQVTLVASAFADPEGDGHLESQFQLTTTPGDWSAPVRDEWLRFENLYSPPGAAGALTGFYSVDTVGGRPITQAELRPVAEHTTYAWRVRYRDAGLVWSAWSEEGRFTTGASTPCVDADGDGWGAPASFLCPAPGADCDDANAAVHPGAVEVPGNGVDEDCDGTTPRCGPQAAVAATGGVLPRGLPTDVGFLFLPLLVAVRTAQAARRRRRT